MDTYDSQIVEVAEDLCRVLGLKPQVRQLRWVDRVTRSKVNSDDFRFALGLAAFPDRMRGKLEPKEWRPLIASTLIFRKIFARNPPGSILVTVLALFVLLVIGRNIGDTLRGQCERASVLPLCNPGRLPGLRKWDFASHEEAEITGGSRNRTDLRERGALVSAQKD